MKKLFGVLGIILFGFAVSWATTYNTITVDGSTSDWQADEYLGRWDSNLYGDLTWDANYFYFRVNDNALHNTDSNWYVFFDVDPQPTPRSGNGTSTPPNTESGPPTLPFYADYAIEVYGSGTNNVQGRGLIYTYSGGSWSSASFSGTGGDAEAWINGNGGSCNELRVKRSAVGNPSKVYIVMYVANNTKSGDVWSVWPTDNPGNNAPNLTHYYGYDNLGSGISPNSASYHDNSLPVELTSFTANVSNGQVVLQWQTESEVNNLGFNIFRSEKEATGFVKLNPSLILGAGNSSENHQYRFVDPDVKPGSTYYYKLENVNFDGTKSEYGPISVQVMGTFGNTPADFTLLQNFPNPFNPGTTISYRIKEAGVIDLSIYDTQGHLIRTLVHEKKEAGHYTVGWDGKNTAGFFAGTGIYFCRLITPTFTKTRKMLLVR